jgi:hypothetical protein
MPTKSDPYAESFREHRPTLDAVARARSLADLRWNVILAIRKWYPAPLLRLRTIARAVARHEDGWRAGRSALNRLASRYRIADVPPNGNGNGNGNG